MEKIKNLKISTNQFLAYCEKTGRIQLGERIVSDFIRSMKMVNPNVKHTDADWLSLFLNDYYILWIDKDIQIIPNNEKEDFLVYFH